jgi:hypothetical protein
MLARNQLIRNRYLIKWRLGGRDSAVFEAFDLQTRVSVALKQATSGAIDSTAASRESFERGARALWQLRHPNLPALLRHFVEGGCGFLVMELVPGDNLATLLARSYDPFPADRVQRWADQLLDALDYVQTLQPPLIHGDIDPQSIKLTPLDTVVLLGFSVPSAAQPMRPATSAQYVSPEQAAGAAPDERGDLFSLAATLYHIATGTPPTPAAERAKAVSDGKSDPLVSPRKLNSHIPAAMSAALMSALALDPAGRPASAAAMRAAIKSGAHITLERRGLVRAIFGAAAVLLFVALLFGLGVFGGSATAQRPTPGASTPIGVAAAGLPTAAPKPEATAPPPATAPAPHLQATSLPSPAPPAATPAPQAAGVEPQQTYTGTLPLQIVVRGTAMDQVETARLVAEGRAPIEAAIKSSSADMLTLSIGALPEPLGGEVSYQVELNGVPSKTSSIMLRDFLERKQVQGILAEYAYTNRVTQEGGAVSAPMRAEPTVDSQAIGQLRNGDEVEVLRADVDGWYAVRSRAGDAGQAGVVGWIERWLVNNREVPATPTPAPPTPVPQPAVFAGRVYSAPTDRAVRCGTSFESSIYGSVEDGGKGISGARLRVTSADGRNTVNVTTGRGGVYNVPGLGCTTWTVRLLSVPNTPNGIRATAVTVRNLNGGRYTSAEVRFRLQR